MKKQLVNSLVLVAASFNLGFSQQPPEGGNVFPQVADGRFEDGSYYTSTLMVVNGASLALCQLGFNGLSPQLKLRDNSVKSENPLIFELRNYGWQIIKTSGTGPFQRGYATLWCDKAVNAQMLYTFYSNSGVKLAEASVFSSPPQSYRSTNSVFILADQRNGERLGIAVANTSRTPTTYRLTIRDRLGGAARATFTVPAGSSIAKFLDEFVDLPAGFVGKVIVTPREEVIGLRFTGPIFTTIPPSDCFDSYRRCEDP